MMNLWQRFISPSFRLGNRYWSVFELLFVGIVAYIAVFQEIQLMIVLGVLILSVVWHEWAHAYVAHRYGDPTAQQLGRLSLNPVVHADPLGSLIVPGLLLYSGIGFVFGWAKPVPVNPRYFKQPSRDMMMVALAGPVMNITLAFLAGFLFKAFRTLGVSNEILDYVIFACRQMVVINLVLAIFNLFPIPPLDGSRILSHFLSFSWQQMFNRLEPYGFLIVMVLAYFGVFSSVFQSILPILLPFFM